MRRSGLVDVLRDRRRTNEADRCDIRMGQDSIDCDLVALHDVEHARGEAGVAQELSQEQRYRGVFLARLEDEGISGRDRVREHPHGHHGREIEGGDAGDDPERLLDRIHIDARRYLFTETTLEEGWDTAGEFQILDTARQFPCGITRHLAVFVRYEFSDRVAVFDDQVTEIEHDLGATGKRRRAPGGECGPRIGNRGVDLLDRGQSDIGLMLAGRRVVDRAGSARARRRTFPVDPVIDRAHVCLLVLAIGLWERTRSGEPSPGPLLGIKPDMTLAAAASSSPTDC